jgi:hypothetical protein
MYIITAKDHSAGFMLRCHSPYFDGDTLIEGLRDRDGNHSPDLRRHAHNYGLVVPFAASAVGQFLAQKLGEGAPCLEMFEGGADYEALAVLDAEIRAEQAAEDDLSEEGPALPAYPDPAP